jgi:hypothetical protein
MESAFLQDCDRVHEMTCTVICNQALQILDDPNIGPFLQEQLSPCTSDSAFVL